MDAPVRADRAAPAAAPAAHRRPLRRLPAWTRWFLPALLLAALAVVLAPRGAFATSHFTDANANLPGVYFSAAAWGDYDNDGDLDLLLTGYTGSAYIARVYRNTNGSFVDTNANLPGVQYSAAAWGDYDSDGDLDLLLAGYTGAERIARVYRNTNGSFADANAGLPGV